MQFLPFVALLSSACGLQASPASPGSAALEIAALSQPGDLCNAPIELFQIELLELAFRSASTMPLDPHIKDRCRAQDATVAACLALEQPTRALAYADHIANWRKASGYADVAYYCATHGWGEHVQPLLDRAESIALTAEDAETGQAWRVDRVRANLARTYLQLGRTDEAERLSQGIVESERGRLSSSKIARLDASQFDEFLAQIDAALNAGGFEQTQAALTMCAHLFARFYADGNLRQRAEDKVKASWGKLPVMVRIDLLALMTEAALTHGDRVKALDLTDEADALRSSTTWTVEHEVPLIAKICGLRYRAGDQATARSGVDAGLQLFEAGQSTVPDLFQAGTLRPLAETYVLMGDKPAALAAYRQVVEAGARNQNPRPRAEDLTATCLSMAVQGVAPDAELRSRLQSILDGLDQLWKQGS
jgi:hypothetical protein